jgi:hypothetical protein
LRAFNETIILLCAGITAIEFFYIPYETVTGPISIYIVPIALLLVFTISFLVSSKAGSLSFYKIILGYCLYSAGLVGVLVPLLTMLTWLFSETTKLSESFALYGYALLYQVFAGVIFAVVGYLTFIKLSKLHASI